MLPRKRMLYLVSLLLCLADHSCELENSINVTCSVVENAKLDGSPICSIRDELLKRPDVLASMQLRYELVPVSSVDAQDVWQLLELNSSTGLISLARRKNAESLDRERLPHFEFIVFVDNARTASTSGSVGRASTAPVHKLQQSIVANVRLVVLDENDNAPSWSHPIVRLNFSEADAKNTTRLFQLAADRDMGLNAAIVYRKQRTHATYPNGSTIVLEESQEPFRFSVQRSAIDTARKDAQTGSLRLVRQLDAETDAAEYKFELIAVDKNGASSGSLSSTATVIVHVGDVNEFAPTFVSAHNQRVSSYYVNVSEAHPVNLPILTIRTVDADRSNLPVTYSLAAAADAQQADDTIAQLVSINENTGELYLKEKLNFEALNDDATAKRIFVPINAIDSGVPTRLTASTTVTITVMDENDNDPEIRITCADDAVLTVDENAEMMENSETDCRVTAIDADSGIFGQVQCIVGDDASEHFALSEQHASKRTPIYRLKVLHTFDYETVRRLDVPIECRDGAGRSSTSTLNVVVNDVNDCAPEFTQAVYNAQVLESSDPDMFVMQVRAVDRDTVGSGRVLYEITEQTIIPTGKGLPNATTLAVASTHDERLLFAIDDRGAVRLVGALDRERFERVVLQLRATDGSNASLFSTAVLNITVLDVNDNAPVTSRVHTFAVAESLDIGATIGTIFLSDMDSSTAQRFTYAIASSECANVLRVDETTGELRTAAYLDRETREHYLCRIDIGDGLFSTHTLVNLTVLDENDNGPVFAFPNRINATVRVTSMPAAGDLIAKVSAVDEDAGMNGLVRYALHQPSNLFEIIEASGELRTKRALQSSDGARYALLILAFDHGQSPRSSSGVLTVLIESSLVHQGELDASGTQRDEAQPSLQPGGFLFSDGMMNVLVTVSLVAVSACLLATLLVVLFLIWKRYVKLENGRRRWRGRKRGPGGDVEQHGSCGRTGATGSGRSAFSEGSSSGAQRGKSHLSVTMFGELLSDVVSSTSSVNEATVLRLCGDDSDVRGTRCTTDISPETDGCAFTLPQSRTDSSLCQHTPEVGLAPEDYFTSLGTATLSARSRESRPSLPSPVAPLTNIAKSWSRTTQLDRRTPLPFQHRFGGLSGQNCSLGHSLSVSSTRSSVYSTLPGSHLRDDLLLAKAYADRLNTAKSRPNGDSGCSTSLHAHCATQPTLESSFKPSGQRPTALFRYADILDGANTQKSQDALDVQDELNEHNVQNEENEQNVQNVPFGSFARPGVDSQQCTKEN